MGKQYRDRLKKHVQCMMDMQKTDGEAPAALKAPLSVGDVPQGDTVNQSSPENNEGIVLELARALAYWLPEKEPLLFQHDPVSKAHKLKYWEAMRLLNSVSQNPRSSRG